MGRGFHCSTTGESPCRASQGSPGPRQRSSRSLETAPSRGGADPPGEPRGGDMCICTHTLGYVCVRSGCKDRKAGRRLLQPSMSRSSRGSKFVGGGRISWTLEYPHPCSLGIVSMGSRPASGEAKSGGEACAEGAQLRDLAGLPSGHLDTETKRRPGFRSWVTAA